MPPIYIAYCSTCNQDVLLDKFPFLLPPDELIPTVSTQDISDYQEDPSWLHAMILLHRFLSIHNSHAISILDDDDPEWENIRDTLNPTTWR